MNLRNRRLCCLLLTIFMAGPLRASGDEARWSFGWYGGQYYNTEPAGLLTNQHAKFLPQYLLAVTANKPLWHAETLPLALEIDGMIGHQFGQAALNEIAAAPVLRWGRFPWHASMQTDFRFAPLGISYTVPTSPLERGRNGKSSRVLNLLLIELAFSLPRNSSKEVFVRLHHRCDVYDVLNNYGANGEDFLVLGYRHHF